MPPPPHLVSALQVIDSLSNSIDNIRRLQGELSQDEQHLRDKLAKRQEASPPAMPPTNCP